MKKPALTLVEILIALVVIAIVMSLIVPAVNRTTPKTNVLLYKKAITNLQEAIDMVKEDTDSYRAPYNYSLTNHFLSVTPENLCTLIADQLIIRGALNCNADSSDRTKSPSFIEMNGMAFWNIGGPSSEISAFKDKNTGVACDPETPIASRDNCVRTVWVDLNGKDKGKNKHGDDQYRLQIRYDGQVMLGTGGDWDTVELLAMGSRNIAVEEDDDDIIDNVIVNNHHKNNNNNNNDDDFISSLYDDTSDIYIDPNTPSISINYDGSYNYESVYIPYNDDHYYYDPVEPVYNEHNDVENNDNVVENNDNNNNNNNNNNNDNNAQEENNNNDNVSYTDKCLKKNSASYCETICDSWLLQLIYIGKGYCK